MTPRFCAPRPRRAAIAAGWLASSLLAGVVAVFCLVLLEVGFRLVDPPPPGAPWLADWRTHVTNRTAPKGSYLRTAELGWALRPGLGFEVAGCRHDVDELGFRTNDNAIELGAEATILAIGDSFTFGHRLDNRETWPSALERKLRVRVVNAGVSGYGLDQMLVQARRSLDAFPRAKTVLVALISDDVDRIRYRMRAGIAKPYFTLAPRGELRLVPADHASAPGEDRADAFQRVLGHSYAVHRVMRKAFPDYWNRGTWNDYREAGIDVAEVGRRIADALIQEVAGERGAELVFLLLPASPTDVVMATPAQNRPARAVASHVAKVARLHPAVFVVDLQSELARRFPGEAERQRLYHDESIDPAGHFNAKGTELVASIVASFLDHDGAVIEHAIGRYPLR